jgi:branched-chain amino acid transport system permease protein
LLLTILVAGLATGAAYGLVAVGIVLIFRATDIVNFAQGEFLMVGAYVYLISSGQELGSVWELFTVVAGGLLLGVVFFAVVHGLLRRAREHLHIIIGTLALSIILVNSARLQFTSQAKRVPGWVVGDDVMGIGSRAVPVISLVIVVCAIAVTVALYWWMHHTESGLATRAVAYNQEFAALSGISVLKTLALNWAVAGALVAVSGMLLSPTLSVYPTMGEDVLFKAFVAAIAGGFSSITGAMLGGLVLGVLELATTAYIGADIKVLVSFTALLLLLLVKPSGLFGTLAVERV